MPQPSTKRSSAAQDLETSAPFDTSRSAATRRASAPFWPSQANATMTSAPTHPDQILTRARRRWRTHFYPSWPHAPMALPAAGVSTPTTLRVRYAALRVPRQLSGTSSTIRPPSRCRSASTSPTPLRGNGAPSTTYSASTPPINPPTRANTPQRDSTLRDARPVDRVGV
jgi:hypothetical protein